MKFLLMIAITILSVCCVGNKLGGNNYGVSVQDYVQIYSNDEAKLLADGNILSITSEGFQIIWTAPPYKGKEVFIPYSMIGSVLKGECDS